MKGAWGCNMKNNDFFPSYKRYQLEMTNSHYLTPRNSALLGSRTSIDGNGRIRSSTGQLDQRRFDKDKFLQPPRVTIGSESLENLISRQNSSPSRRRCYSDVSVRKSRSQNSTSKAVAIPGNLSTPGHIIKKKKKKPSGKTSLFAAALGKINYM